MKKSKRSASYSLLLLSVGCLCKIGGFDTMAWVCGGAAGVLLIVAAGFYGAQE